MSAAAVSCKAVWLQCCPHHKRRPGIYPRKAHLKLANIIDFIDPASGSIRPRHLSCSFSTGDMSRSGQSTERLLVPLKRSRKRGAQASEKNDPVHRFLADFTIRHRAD